MPKPKKATRALTVCKKWNRLYGKVCNTEATLRCSVCDSHLLGDEPETVILCLYCFAAVERVNRSDIERAAWEVLRRHITYRNDGSTLCGIRHSGATRIEAYRVDPSPRGFCLSCKRSAKTILAGKGRGWLAKNIQKGLGIPEKARRI